MRVILLTIWLALVSALTTAAPEVLGFSAGFSSGMVLQRGPAKAALYGYGSGSISVAITGVDGNGADISYTVTTTANRANEWKVLLRPVNVPGGNFAATLGSTHTSAHDRVVLSNLTFGDVYFCSGRK